MNKGTLVINGIDYSNGGGGGGDIPDNIVLFEDTIPTTPLPRDADTLEGHSAEYFASKSDISNIEETTVSLGTGSVRLTKLNKLVTISYVTNSGTVSHAQHCSIPENFRPKYTVSGVCDLRVNGSETHTLGNFQIKPSGDLYIFINGGSSQSGFYPHFSVAYIME